MITMALTLSGGLMIMSVYFLKTLIALNFGLLRVFFLGCLYFCFHKLFSLDENKDSSWNGLQD